MTDLDACPVRARGLAQLVFHVALVRAAAHVNEIDDDQPTEIAQTQLAGYFIRGLQVGGQRGLLDVAALSGARRIDVDGNQGFSLVDHQGAARRQPDVTRKGLTDLTLNAVTHEKRLILLVVLDTVLLPRHRSMHKIQRTLIQRLAVDEDFLDV